MGIQLQICTSYHQVYSVTYIPLEPPHSDSTSCPSACQAHKVTTTNVAGKQRRTDLVPTRKHEREKQIIEHHIV